MDWLGMTDPELDRMVAMSRRRPFTKFAKAMEQVRIERQRWWDLRNELSRVEALLAVVEQDKERLAARVAECEEALRFIACGKTGSYGSASALACSVLEEA